MGAAVGTIMATIITAHIRNIRRKSAPVQTRMSVMFIPMAMPLLERSR